MVLNWLKRRTLSRQGERRLLVTLARAEEEIVRTHVQNAVELIEAMGTELSSGRALDLYLDEMDVDEPHATIIAQRVLSRIEDTDGLK